MVKKIDRPIVGYRVKKDDAPEQAAPVEETGPQLEEMHEAIKRPRSLIGETYKIKMPTVEHALYMTVNDIVLNEGTEHAQRMPFEIFLNSKSMDHFQWVTALTRIVSATFRKGGQIEFLIEELKSVFDPNGGGFIPGTGRYSPSVVAEIGVALEEHLQKIGVMDSDLLDEHQKAAVAEKQAAYEAQQQKESESEEPSDPTKNAAGYPKESTLCPKCNTMAVIVLDKCPTCLNCGDSKCG